VTENVQETVPLQREEVRVEPEPITDDNIDAATSGPEITEDEHEVTLHAEEPVVEKRTVPKERIRLDKDVHTDEETVTEEVRKERIEAEATPRAGSGFRNNVAVAHRRRTLPGRRAPPTATRRLEDELGDEQVGHEREALVVLHDGAERSATTTHAGRSACNALLVDEGWPCSRGSLLTATGRRRVGDSPVFGRGASLLWMSPAASRRPPVKSGTSPAARIVTGAADVAASSHP
jgi:hypothetical protein